MERLTVGRYVRLALAWNRNLRNPKSLKSLTGRGVKSVQKRTYWTLHIDGVFVLLLVEVVALRWVHPAAFLVFAFMGIPLALLGIVIYLYSSVCLVVWRTGTIRLPSAQRQWLNLG